MDSRRYNPGMAAAADQLDVMGQAMAAPQGMGDVQKRTNRLRALWDEHNANMEPYRGKPHYKKAPDTKMLSTRPEKETAIFVKSLDALATTSTISKKENRKPVLVTSLCSNRGGGVKSGIFGKEEDICLRSNYYKALKKIPNEYYPLQPGVAFLAKDVQITRSLEFEPVNPYLVDILGVVLQRRPGIINMNGKDIYEHERDREQVIACINTVVNLVLKHGYNAVIINKMGIEEDGHPLEAFMEILRDTFRASGIEIVIYCDQHDRDDKEAHDIYTSLTRVLTQ